MARRMSRLLRCEVEALSVRWIYNLMVARHGNCLLDFVKGLQIRLVISPSVELKLGIMRVDSSPHLSRNLVRKKP